MTAWTSDELDKVGGAEELTLPARRADGVLRRPVTIRVVRHGDDRSVRSVNGVAGRWHRNAEASHEGHVEAGGVARDVTVVDADPTLAHALDAACQSKHRRSGVSIVGTVVSPHARDLTLARVPRDDGVSVRNERSQAMATRQEPSGAEKMFGDFAPALVRYTDEVLFGQDWTRPELSPKERSLVTVASLVTSGAEDQLVYHLGLARQNGASEQELIEAITHLAFYAGWPKAMSAMAVAKRVFRGGQGDPS